MSLLMKPILRWAGSKRKLIQTLLEASPATFDRYVEPFAGSACLFFALAPNKAILGDINTHLIEAYHVIRRQPVELIRTLNLLPQGKAAYYRIRKINPCSLTKFERALRFLYLNRFCFNALYRTNRAGFFNVPYGSKTGLFPEETAFHEAALLLRNAQLCNEDFEQILERTQPGDFVYLDPPYASRSRNGRNEYGCDSFTSNDIPRLISSVKVLHIRNIRFLLSYSYSVDFLLQLPRRVMTSIRVQRQIAGHPSKRKVARELLLTNEDLFGITNE